MLFKFGFGPSNKLAVPGEASDDSWNIVQRYNAVLKINFRKFKDNDATKKNIA